MRHCNALNRMHTRSFHSRTAKELTWRTQNAPELLAATGAYNAPQTAYLVRRGLPTLPKNLTPGSALRASLRPRNVDFFPMPLHWPRLFWHPPALTRLVQLPSCIVISNLFLDVSCDPAAESGPRLQISRLEKLATKSSNDILQRDACTRILKSGMNWSITAHQFWQFDSTAYKLICFLQSYHTITYCVCFIYCTAPLNYGWKRHRILDMITLLYTHSLPLGPWHSMTKSELLRLWLLEHFLNDISWQHNVFLGNADNGVR